MWRIADAISEQRLAVGGGNARAPARRPGRRTGLECRLDGGGDELRSLCVDGDVAAHPIFAITPPRPARQAALDLGLGVDTAAGESTVAGFGEAA